MKVFLNDKIIPEEEASISIWDRGFLLGDGVFETVKFTEGKVEFWPEHWSRWVRSCETTGIPLNFTEEGIDRVIKELCEQNSLKDAAVRLTLSRGVGGPGLSFPQKVRPTLLITALPISKDFERMRREGITAITLVKQGHSESSDLGHVKATNYLQSVMAKNEAESRGADEALFVDAEGAVLEFTTANVFYNLDGIWATPPLSRGILPGIIRKKLLEGFAQAKIEVIERDLFVKELPQVREMLMCSSVRGWVPLRRVDEFELEIHGALEKKAIEILEVEKKKENK